MFDNTRLLTITAFTKWISGEALSAPDLERIIEVFAHIPLQLDIIDSARAAALQVKLRSVIHDNFMPKGE